jgi:hypothetical protein
MCIYCHTNNYRKIYENHVGPIPREQSGRSYEIHHIDGNHNNNDPANLIAVTIQEHYNAHYAAGDWAACLYIKGQRMEYSFEEISELALKNAQQRIKSGNHPFIGPTLNLKMLAEGKHASQRIECREAISRYQRKQVADGKHHLLGGEIQRQLVATGKCNLLGGNVVQKQLADGKHPSQIKVSCIHCKKVFGKGQFVRYHGEKCKLQY